LIKRLLTLIFFASSGLISTSIKANTTTAQKEIIHIGITANRKPFVYLDEQQQAKGMLVEIINSICTEIDANCIYTVNNFPSLLEKLQNSGLQALLVIDQVVIPDIDYLKLSAPLCKMKPLFVQPASDKSHNAIPKDYEKKILGVLEGSIMHLDLLDNYSESSQIRPYMLLESGVFDLAHGRIDALYVAESFYHARVKTTRLIDQKTGRELHAFEVGKNELPKTSIRLAIHESANPLLEKVNAAIKKVDLEQNCLDVLMSK